MNSKYPEKYGENVYLFFGFDGTGDVFQNWVILFCVTE